MRLKSGAEVSLRTLSKHLQKELCNLRLKKGLDVINVPSNSHY